MKECVSKIRKGVKTSALIAVPIFVFRGGRQKGKSSVDWLKCNKREYILSDPILFEDKKPPQNWTLERDPFLLETSTPGIFAAGDVRYGTNHRVASAAGEGAISYALIKEYLKTL